MANPVKEWVERNSVILKFKFFKFHAVGCKCFYEWNYAFKVRAVHVCGKAGLVSPCFAEH